MAETAPGAEIFVVDNDSRDGIGKALAREVPQARLLIEPQNRGYGAACNRSARQSERPYLLFLNSDAYPRPAALSALTAVLEANPEAAAVGPRLVNPDGTLQSSIRRLPTPWRIFCESFGLASFSGGRGMFRGHTATREDHSRPRAVEALMGAALLVRRAAFEEAGEFDESFFLYAEETDLMARWKDRGYRLLYEPRAEVVHEGGASGGDLSFGELHAGLARYARKHHGRLAGLFVRAALAAGAAARYLLALATPGDRGRSRRARYRAALLRETSGR